MQTQGTEYSQLVKVCWSLPSKVTRLKTKPVIILIPFVLFYFQAWHSISFSNKSPTQEGNNTQILEVGQTVNLTTKAKRIILPNLGES